MSTEVTVPGQDTTKKPLPPPLVVQVTYPRTHWVPHAAVGALVVAAAAARVAVAAGGDEKTVAVWTAGTAFVVAVVAATRARRRVFGPGALRRVHAFLTFGIGWLATVTLTGLSVGAVGVLMLVGYSLSLHWWRQHPIRFGGDDDRMPVPGEEDMFIARWAANVGAKGKALAGSRLSNPEIIKAGYRYTLHLVPGVQTVGQAREMPETLRGGLRLMPGQEVIVEEHPDEPAPTAILTVVTRPQVRKPKEWPGPAEGFDSTTGRVNLGPFVDGEGIAQWTVYREDGMFGGYLQGGPGSGKSRMIEQIAMSCAASESHPTSVWFGDGQDGNSSALLVEHADYSATTYEAIYNMLAAAVRVMQINGAENRLNKKVGFTPTAARPGTLVFVDECHNPLNPNKTLLAAAIQQLMTTIAREGRKVGVALILASQSPTLDAFGNTLNTNLADTLRSCVLQGNGVILKSKTQNAKTVFGVDVDPRQFPKLPGYGYLADPEEGARSAPFRGYWVTNDLAAYWPVRIVWRCLPRRQANHAGRTYADRKLVAAVQGEADQALLDRADAGTVDDLGDLLTVGQAAASAPAGNTMEFGDSLPALHRVPKFWETEPAGQAQPAEVSLQDGHRKVLAAIRSGRTSPKEIGQATGYGKSRVHELLNNLQDWDLVGSAGHGKYRLLESAAA